MGPTAGKIVARAGFSQAAHPGKNMESSQESKFLPGLPGCAEDVFNKVGGWSIFHLTVC